MSEMISLYDYTGYPDKNERGQKYQLCISAYPCGENMVQFFMDI